MSENIKGYLGSCLNDVCIFFNGTIPVSASVTLSARATLLITCELLILAQLFKTNDVVS